MARARSTHESRTLYAIVSGLLDDFGFRVHTPDRTREGKTAVERRAGGEGFAANLGREGTAGIPAALVHRSSRPDAIPSINMRGDGTLGGSSSSFLSIPPIDRPSSISICDDVTTALIASQYY